jgi:hypothetical protein
MLEVPQSSGHTIHAAHIERKRFQATARRETKLIFPPPSAESSDLLQPSHI